MRRLACIALALALVASGCRGGTEDPGPGQPGKSAGRATAAAEPAEARQMYDEAVKRRLGGDEIGYRDALLQLAARHPETRYGRHARRAMRDSGLLAAWLGITAAIAIPSFMKYMRRAKTSEAYATLEALYAWEVERRLESGRFVAAGPFPADVPKEAVKLTPEDWARAGFERFSGPRSTRFQYQALVSEDGRGFTLRARGDTEGDGAASTIERCGELTDAGEVVPCPTDYRIIEAWQE